MGRVLDTLLAALPVLAVAGAVACGLRATGAAVAGLLAVAGAVLLRYPLDVAAARADILRWLPLMVEILLIIGGGLVLAALTTRTGSQQVLARRLADAAGTPVVTVLLVVHGITPFSESVMGFGVGAMIGVPLLLHVGIPPARAAIVSLLGLAAVPWGAMAPGILVAAGMTGLSLQELGVASAKLSLLPFVVCGIAGVLVAFGRAARWTWLLAAAGTGVVFWLGVIGANVVAGTPPAGALGALVTILVVLAVRRAQRALPGSRDAPAQVAGHDDVAGTATATSSAPSCPTSRSWVECSSRVRRCTLCPTRPSGGMSRRRDYGSRSRASSNTCSTAPNSAAEPSARPASRRGTRGGSSRPPQRALCSSASSWSTPG